MLVPDDVRRLLLFEDQSPSAPADWTLPPVARMNIPSVPASVGPYADEPHRWPSTALVDAPTDTTLRPFAGSRTPEPEFPGAIKASDHGIALAKPSKFAVRSV